MGPLLRHICALCRLVPPNYARRRCRRVAYTIYADVHLGFNCRLYAIRGHLAHGVDPSQAQERFVDRLWMRAECCISFGAKDALERSWNTIIEP